LSCFSCAALPTKETVSPSCTHSWEKVTGATAAGRDAISSEFTILLEGEQKAFFTGVLHVSAPDKMRWDIFTPIGTLAAIVAVNGTSFSAFLAAPGKVYRGTITADSMERIVHLPLLPNEFAGILLGSAEVLSRGMWLTGCVEMERMYSFSRSGESRQVWLDGQNRPLRYRGRRGLEDFWLRVQYDGDVPRQITGKYKNNIFTMQILHYQEKKLSQELFEVKSSQNSGALDGVVAPHDFNF
jgi:hypothetical protein